MGFTVGWTFSPLQDIAFGKVASGRLSAQPENRGEDKGVHYLEIKCLSRLCAKSFPQSSLYHYSQTRPRNSAKCCRYQLRQMLVAAFLPVEKYYSDSDQAFEPALSDLFHLRQNFTSLVHICTSLFAEQGEANRWLAEQGSSYAISWRSLTYAISWRSLKLRTAYLQCRGSQPEVRLPIWRCTFKVINRR